MTPETLAALQGAGLDASGLRALIRTVEGMRGARAESGDFVRDKDLDLQTVEATSLHAVSALIAADALPGSPPAAAPRRDRGTRWCAGTGVSSW